ncbi:MAG: hypothetical protein ACRECT_05255 [Thermoplasmata archaeon]
MARGGGVILAVAVLGLMVLSSTGSVIGSSAGLAGATTVDGSSPSADTTSVTIESAVPTSNLTPSFWGATTMATASLSPNTSLELNATPVREVAWPGGYLADQFDYRNGTVHGDLAGVSVAAENVSQFVAWCRSVGCDAIFEVPGEIDSPSTAAAEVRYVEQTLGFQPDYWEIGNEPGLWQHFGLPWSEWGSNLTASASPPQYADLVHSYIAAMRAVDPSIRVIGLPGVGHGAHGETTWIAATVSENGPNLSAVGIHVYPAGLGPSNPKNATLQNFYATLTGSASLPTRVPADLAAIRSACPTCGPIPLFVSEFGSAIAGHPDDPFVGGFAQVPYVAAELIQAVDLNVSETAYFAFDASSIDSWFPVPNNSAPIYQLYSEILSRLGTEVLPVNVTSMVGGIYALATTREPSTSPIDLLVVNANATGSISFPTAAMGPNASGPIETWTWNSSTEEPVAADWPAGLPADWQEPASSLVLFEQPRVATYPLTVHVSGLPPSQRWFLEVGSQTETTNTTQLTFFLPNGQYRQTGPVQYPTSGERISIALPSNVTVDNAPAGEEGTYGLQYLVTTAANPPADGTTDPANEWVDPGAEVRVSATNASGFELVGWIGRGPGNYSGTADPASFVPGGPVVEVAEFALPPPRYTVEFEETGLPAGTPWGVTIGGANLSGSSSELFDSLRNGRYSFTVEVVPGFSESPNSGFVTVAGATVTVPVAFAPLGVASYPVWFNETGLPLGTGWAVNLSGKLVGSTGGSIPFREPNASYPFVIGSVPGYSAGPPNGLVTVAGRSVAVPVTFTALAPALYPIWFNESGLPTGAGWSVALGGVPATATTVSIEFSEPAGNYAYLIPAVGNWTPVPDAGNASVTVSGTSVSVTYSFTYALTFAAPQGRADSALWSVTVDPTAVSAVRGDDPTTSTQSTSATTLVFAEPNGTYSYAARVAGDPSYQAAGSFTIQGDSAFVTLAPIPPSSPGGPGPNLGGEALWVAAAVAAAIAVGLAWYAVGRRRRSPPPAPDPPAEGA